MGITAQLYRTVGELLHWLFIRGEKTLLRTKTWHIVVSKAPSCLMACTNHCWKQMIVIFCLNNEELLSYSSGVKSSSCGFLSPLATVSLSWIPMILKLLSTSYT